jgi:hypothetical protein
MSKPCVSKLLLVGLSSLSLVGCANLPGSKGTQGAVAGGAGGAAVGAAVGGEHHRLLGALLGGAIGSAGGYVVGANSDRILGRDQNSADQAVRQSQAHPATAQDALRATTADLNNDGFVTLDEVAAMRDAGLSDAQMLERLRTTGQVFELTPEQRQYLLGRGVSPFVVDQMESINKETRDRLLSNQPGPVPQAVPLPPPPPGPPVGTPPIISQPPATLPPRY